MKESFTLQDVTIEMDGNIIGGAQSLSFAYDQDNKPIHEGGTHKPREILDGPIVVTGTIERLFLDKETITALVDIKGGKNPYFDIVGVTKNKDPQRKIIIINAKLKGFKGDLTMVDETKIMQDFDALDMDIQ